MATKLESNVTRESTVQVNDREIQVTLTADQRISFKLKGMKSGEVSISIEELYGQLTETEAQVKKPESKIKSSKKPVDYTPTISLYDLRTHNLTTKMDFKVKLQLEALICELIKQDIKIFSEA